MTRVALVNPAWDFAGSTYFGCREPHLPLELAYAASLLRVAGHHAQIFDAQLHGASLDDLARDAAAFEPDLTVITTAPSYLFWRCAPPELRVPMATARALAPASPKLVVVGPHASTTPAATLRKLHADAVVLGECEEVLVELADVSPAAWDRIDSVAIAKDGAVLVKGTPHASDLAHLPSLRWDTRTLARHRHHHHRFDREPDGPGAEIEASRGCPFHCTFCAKDNFRDAFRKRPLPVLLDELDALIRAGVTYVYFIDEIFVVDVPLLEALCERDVRFGVQMRIDHWQPAHLDLLGRAGCVSVEAGVESITPRGRSLLAKKCKRSTDELAELLIHAKRRIPFVQANLLGGLDDGAAVASFRQRLREQGVWSNEPVPLFPYPGSPEYTQRWGVPDDQAWERAHTQYLADFDRFSDVQEERPLPMCELEPAH